MLLNLVPIISFSLLIFVLNFRPSYCWFTCQGGSYNSALNNCPDKGTQKLSSGGFVKAYVRRATNIPNKDYLISRISDPYVEFKVGNNVRRQSKRVTNSLNPVWNDMVDLGLLGSATEISVSIWDYDEGLEFGDDLLVSKTIRVPFCSTFNASVSVVNCGEPFGCSSDESTWEMPSRQLCNESSSISFSYDGPCTSGGTCLFLDFLIVPFQMNIELSNTLTFPNKPLLSSAARINNGITYPAWVTNKLFGYPFVQDTIDLLEFTDANPETANIEGALMYRTYAQDRYKGKENEIYFYGSVNFPAYIYVCRNELDNVNGIPSWLQSFNRDNITATRLRYTQQDVVVYYGCFYISHPGTFKNKWGGVEDNVIAFRSNTINGHDSNTALDSSFYSNMYIILAIPRYISNPNIEITIEYDHNTILEIFASYGIIWAWFMFLVARFLHRMHYRVDRIMTYLVTRVYTGNEKSIIATLFMNDGQSPSNVEFRSNLYHATNIIHFFLSIPFLLLVGWGFACASAASPQSVGYAVVFIGIACIFLWFGFSLWESQKWQMSPNTLSSILMSVLFCLIFFISVIFADPAVKLYNYPLDFTALSLVCGTINTIPLLLLIFRQDKTYKVNLKIVIDNMIQAVENMKQVGTSSTHAKKMSCNKIIHALLGSCYTINPKVPLFKYATVLKDLGNESTSTQKSKFGDNLYNFALFILFVYLMISIARTEYPSLAFLHCLALMLLDCIHGNLASGDVKWSPGFHILLLVAGRLAITSSTGRFWLINYSVAFLIYCWALIREIIDQVLPMLSQRQAGEAAFSGKDTSSSGDPNVAGTAHFSLGCLVFFFVSLVLVSAFGSSDALPLPDVEIWGSKWPMYVIGLIAFLVIIVSGLSMATYRAFYLDKNGLLRGWARECYLIRPNIRLPILLALFLETSIICSGLLIYATTGSSAILVLAIYVPIIVLCLSYALKVWLSNDYVLIVWPPQDDNKNNTAEAPSDLEVAFNMIGNLFGDESQPDDTIVEEFQAEEPTKRTLKGFKLPALQATGGKIEGPIKMPPLPLKSVLRKKRSALGIKTSAPIVKDLRARDDADSDKFGNGDVLDINDPWAQFEAEEQEPTEDDVQEAKKLDTSMRGTRRGFSELTCIKYSKKAFSESRVGKWLIKYGSACMRRLRSSMQRYEKVSPRLEEDVEPEVVGADAGNKTGEEIISPNQKGELSDPENNAAKEGVEEQQQIVEQSPEIDFSKVSFWKAVLYGYLTEKEYYALFSWFGGMFFIMLMGITLAKSVPPPWLGLVVWVSLWTFICSAIPIVKYYNTYIIDETSYAFAIFVGLFHFLFCVSFFAAHEDGNPHHPASLWILDYFVYYPLFLYLIVELYRWRDNNWVIEKLDKDGDGSITWREYIVYFKAYPIIFLMIILLIMELYVWADSTLGTVCILILLVSMFGYLFARDWATHDFFLSPEFRVLGDTILKAILLITFLVTLFLPTIPLFPLSVFFFTLIFRCSTKIISRVIIADVDTMIFFSPYVMPIYSYDPRHNDVFDETPVAKQLFIALVAGILWGASMAIFLYPVSVGIGVACLFLLGVASIVAAAVSYVPMRLGKYANMLTPTGILEATETATKKFTERKSGLDVDIEGYDGDVVNESYKNMKNGTGRNATRPAIEIAADTIEDVRSLTHVKYEQPTSITLIDNSNASEERWYLYYWNILKKECKRAISLIFNNDIKGWRVHNESLFTFKDAVAEALLTGRGPFGFVGCKGLWFKLFKLAQSHPRLHFLHQPWLDAYDQYGNRVHAVKLTESLNCVAVLSRLTMSDEAMDLSFQEETRCAVHFILMLLVASDAKLQREKILFQKFLRENRFRLASNGISPPSDIFTSSSFASIDIPLVAVWLSTLSSEERERFHQLKATFSEEQKLRDEATDAEDLQIANDAVALLEARYPREKAMVDKLRRDFSRSQAERVKQFAATLSGSEKFRFDILRESWMTDLEVVVDPSDQDLYEKFRGAVMQQADEATEYARQVIGEVEAAQRDCRIGEYGRTYQFVDAEFAPGDHSIGDCPARSAILGWRCAPGISEVCQLFDGGTDPDDVEEGVFQDGWLLSAISMIAAAGGVGDGGVEEQVLNLFIGHYGIDGDISYSTEVGCFGLRLYKQGIWNPIIIDDIFPMLKQDKWTNENRGMACAHSKECSELWVSLIEKAFAKYYGSYAALKEGYVHHALQDLTGAESECIPISNASRGPGKRALWDMLMRYRSNGFILGAGTGDAAQADKELQEMGIMFNAAYTIYEVKHIDKYKLLKLRNPPGDHDEWKGDWSDRSPLWTKRLKRKLGWTDADDNTFWMSFDDFCNVFRYLYVCKWYCPSKWTEIKHIGQWKLADMDQHEAPEGSTTLGIRSNANTAAVKIPSNTAGGLPSRHNPGCRLENNPHYKLVIHRPTEIRLTLSQTDTRGVARGEVLPAAIYICRSSHPTMPMRLKTLNRDNVVFYSGTPKKERTQHLYATMKPGMYVVMVGAYVAGMEGIFSLSILSNYKVDLVQFYPTRWLPDGSKAMDGDDKSVLLTHIINKGLTALVGTKSMGNGAAKANDSDDDDEDLEKGLEKPKPKGEGSNRVAPL